jgi:hypothetical protein
MLCSSTEVDCLFLAPGRIAWLRKAPQVLQNVVTYTVVLATATPEDVLLPGMTALAKIPVSRGGKSLKPHIARRRFRTKSDRSILDPQYERSGKLGDLPARSLFGRS